MINLILTIIIGLIIGSFLNAVIHRLKTEESFLRGRSYCPKCKHKLALLDLVPVFSFIFLGGKCRYCHKKISWQYPVVELVTALCFILILITQGIGLSSFLFAIITCFLIVLFVYDLKHYLVPDKIILPGIVLAAIFSFVLGEPWLNLALGCLIGGGFFMAQILISQGKWVGGGDVRLGIFMGLLLGWQKLIFALFLAYVIGALVGLALILWKRKTWKSQIAFGTFLMAVTFIVMLWGDLVLDWYLGMLLG